MAGRAGLEGRKRALPPRRGLFHFATLLIAHDHLRGLVQARIEVVLPRVGEGPAHHERQQWRVIVSSAADPPPPPPLRPRAHDSWSNLACEAKRSEVIRSNQKQSRARFVELLLRQVQSSAIKRNQVQSRARFVELLLRPAVLFRQFLHLLDKLESLGPQL